jgi:methionyl-tRNA formyltransferase
MRVVFAGTPEFAATALDALLQAGHEILGVLTQPDRPAGRGMKLQASPVKARAMAAGVSVIQPQGLRLGGKFDADAQAARTQLEAWSPELMVVAAYGLILPQWVLDLPRRGCLNIHGSLLPRWRGAAPIQRCIEAGDAETGNTIMQMDAGLDTGAMLMRESFPLAKDETTASLHDRLAAQGARMIVEALAHIDTLMPQPQPGEGVTYAAKIDKAEARIAWTRPAVEVDRQIRGLSPFPGAWTEIRGERVKLLRSRLALGSGLPGQVLGGFTVACGTGAVEITEAQREGKRPLPVSEILKGLSLPDRLG